MNRLIWILIISCFFCFLFAEERDSLFYAEPCEGFLPLTITLHHEYAGYVDEYYPLGYRFTNTLTGDITEVIFTDQDIQVTLDKSGYYNVGFYSLYPIINGDYYEWETLEEINNYIRIKGVSFDISDIAGSIPHIVNVNSFCELDDTAIYNWDFDNDQVVDSQEPNPVFTYNTPGEFTINLQVQAGEESFNSESYQIIKVTEPFLDLPYQFSIPFTDNFLSQEENREISLIDYNLDGEDDFYIKVTKQPNKFLTIVTKENEILFQEDIDNHQHLDITVYNDNIYRTFYSEGVFTVTNMTTQQSNSIAIDLPEDDVFDVGTFITDSGSIYFCVGLINNYEPYSYNSKTSIYELVDTQLIPVGEVEFGGYRFLKNNITSRVFYWGDPDGNPIYSYIYHKISDIGNITPIGNSGVFTYVNSTNTYVFDNQSSTISNYYYNDTEMLVRFSGNDFNLSSMSQEVLLYHTTDLVPFYTLTSNEQLIVFVRNNDQLDVYTDGSDFVPVSEEYINPVISNNTLSNYPNPFNNSGHNRNAFTTISFELAEQSDGSLSVFNLKGQMIKKWDLVNLSKGENSIIWDGKDNHSNSVPSGIYFYQLRTSDTVQTKKMMLIK
ncbi:MAG: T9SS type A sorting domain-containing protein [Candidatus Cloacimonetes bacterium]|nr:T9SS type A sorting domain-containing protein [Candidatus Cloacimonadota bacterium]